MSGGSETERFIRSVFGSIWALELLLILRGPPQRDWSRGELIQALRASEQVLARSCADLSAAGLIEQQGDQLRYAPSSSELDTLVTLAASLYEARPALVRRIIVGGPHDSITRFADAFRFRRD
jgi:hypothetical protein